MLAELRIREVSTEATLVVALQKLRQILGVDHVVTEIHRGVDRLEELKEDVQASASLGLEVALLVISPRMQWVRL